MEGLSEVELARLATVRRRLRSASWQPDRDGLGWAERHGIVLEAVPEAGGMPGTRRFRCRLRRESAAGPCSLETLFQAAEAYPVPPDAVELLRWLAGAVAGIAVSEDLSGWGLLHGIAADGRVRALPYRGVVYEEEDLAAFVAGQRRRAGALREFLGPAAFAELAEEVGMA